MSSYVFSGTAHFEDEKTTCYVFKQDKLVKQADCTLSGITHGNMYGGGKDIDLKIKNYGTFNIVTNTDIERDEELGQTIYKVTQILNKEFAVEQGRDRASLQPLSQYEYQKREKIWWENFSEEKMPNYLVCYINSSVEICFSDHNAIY